MARLAPEVQGARLMDFKATKEPGPRLHHRTGLEGEHSEAPNVHKSEYYIKAMGRVSVVSDRFDETGRRLDRHQHGGAILPFFVPRYVFSALESALGGGYEAALELAARLRTFLSKSFLRRLLWATWCALGDEEAEEVAEILLGGAGMPIPPLDDIEGSAAIWAACASRMELEAYSRAAFTALPSGPRAKLLRWL